MATINMILHPTDFLLTGSVAEEVLRKASCPELAVKAP
jgi:nucleotide-binding universal stress UspA family protein